MVIVVALCYWQPKLKLILPILAGVATWVFTGAWWGGIIVTLVSISLISSMVETTVKRGNYGWTINCYKCKSDNIDIVEETNTTVSYNCNKCGYKGVWNLK